VSPIGRKSTEEGFFDLFERAAANAERSAELLTEMVADYPERAEIAREVLLCEQQGDSITHALIQRLGDGARPPLSRSAIHGLATTIDDVVDYTEEVADLFGLYKIEASMDQAHALADVLLQACRQLTLAIGTLRSGEPMTDYIVEIHRLENEGDRISRDAIASLFEGGVDPMVVIRWKDIFENLEEAIDACETVAHTLEGGTFDA
jgi:predicted phosphate transport protein (TIGR00153 family)